MIRAVVSLLAAASLFAGPLADALRGRPQHEPQEQVAKKIQKETQMHYCEQHIADSIVGNDLKTLRKAGLSGEELSCRTNEGFTPLMLAAYRDKPTIAAYLLKLGASVDERDANGHTALHLAAVHGNIEIAKMLLANGAAIDAANQIGQTPLMAASYYGNAYTAALLLSKGASCEAKDGSGHTARQLASSVKRAKVLLELDKRCKAP